MRLLLLDSGANWFTIAGAIGVLSLIILWFVVMVVWALTGKRAIAGKSVGGGPFWYHADLEEGESVRASVGVIFRWRRRVAYSGMLYFSDRRLVLTPGRESYSVWAPQTYSVYYRDIRDWRFERIRQIGLAHIVPFKRRALLVATNAGGEYVYWAAPGYDIESAAERSLPREHASPTSKAL